jgi:ssDNA-binding Zn-finger/Zn-ribbon topoisomerase 1
MVLGESKKIGDPCPKCGNPLERRAGTFYWRGDYQDGAYCEPCNALWAIEGEEIEPLRLARRPKSIACDEA